MLCRWPPIGKGLSNGAVTLAGDAFHPMTPNLGQGGCTALEVGALSHLLQHNRAYSCADTAALTSAEVAGAGLFVSARRMLACVHEFDQGCVADHDLPSRYRSIIVLLAYMH